ncbi:unnamed protein product [Oreochromis niloticus]|nr:unnamed protein product [Mustela putorius furo]
MDPAAFSPPRELQEAIIDSASKLINQWLEHEGEASLYIVEANLQHLISGYPWLLDSLHPLVQNFILHELHLHPPAATARLLASMEDVPSEPPDEELPGPSELSPRKKRRSCRRRGTPQPDVGTCKLPAVSPSSPSHYEQGTHFIITSAGSLKLAISETVAPSRASPEAGCQSPANSGPLAVKTPAPAASLENFTEQSQPSSPAESSSEFALLPPSSAGCIGEHFQPSEDCIPLLLPESSHCAAQSQPVSTLPEVFVPAASVSVSTGGPKEPVQSQATLAGGSGEPTQRPVSSAGGPEEPVQPQVSSAGGSGEPSQPHASSAGGSEEPIQHYALSAGGPGKSVQSSPAESSPATSTPSPAASPPTASASPPAASPISGSAAATLPSGSAAMSSSTISGSAAATLPSGSAAVSSSTPGPASVSSSTPGPASSTPGPASMTLSSPGPVSASPSPGPASASSGPASSGPAVATPSLDPARPVPPRLCRPLSRPLVGRYGHQGRPPERVCCHRWLRSRPPDLLSGRHCLPSGRPPDWFCLHRRRCLVHGRPPELFARHRRCRVHGRPPELFARCRCYHLHGSTPRPYCGLMSAPFLC